MSRNISLRKMVDTLPTNLLVYRICRRYVDHYNGENNSDIHTNGELRWLRTILPDCETVFDVGANVGDWSALALSSNPTIQLHCFEPSATTFQSLKARSWGGGQVLLNQVGLSSSTGEMTLHLFAEEAGGNSLYQREGLDIVQTQSELIRLDTLDAYCQRQAINHIDLLKLDVEGHELMVLKGATQMLDQGRIHRIQFEYGGTYIDARILFKDMFELLTSHGYHLHKIYPHELRLVDHYDQRLENFQYQNWVALR